MFKQRIIFISLLISCLNISVAQRFSEPMSARTASYEMDIILDVENKRVYGEQSLLFTNPSADTIWTMPFHMYYNAWKNNLTDFMTENSRIPRSKPNDEIENCDWSWIKILEVKDALGNELTENMAYIQPDNNNTYDHTVLEIKLKEAILPYQSYRLQMKWVSQIPHLLVRTGYSKDYFFMAQWYPKLGVYEAAGTRFAQKGQWNCHQYHAATEYFGEYGVYHVRLTVPSSHIVGASGFLLNKEEKGELTTHTYLAEDVIDFAWTSHPGFMEVNDQWEDVAIRLLIRPEHSCTTDRFMKAAKSTLSFYKDYLGTYPYPALTIVSPPYYGLNSGAMEYPTLVTVPTMCDFPQGIKTTETLTIHELTHQFFMQILGTNEQEEPWMDEGFTSFFEAKILDQAFPEGTISWDYMRMNIGAEELRRGRFFNADNIKVNPLSDFGWQFKHGSYAQIVYGKTAVCLLTLEGLIGEDVMRTLMRTYFQRWKFKHPGRQDFIDIVNEVVHDHFDEAYAQNVQSFFHQAIFGTEECDYAVHSIDNQVQKKPLGYLKKNTEDCRYDTTSEAQPYESTIILFRLGEFIVPQEILVTFDNGDELLEQWDGQARSHELNYTGHRQVVSVHIDPGLKVPIDRNLINNSYTLQQDSPGIMRYFTSFLSWMQSIMLSMTALV